MNKYVRHNRLCVPAHVVCGLLILTTTAVTLLRDGRSGGGIWQAMKRAARSASIHDRLPPTKSTIPESDSEPVHKKQKTSTDPKKRTKKNSKKKSDESQGDVDEATIAETNGRRRRRPRRRHRNRFQTTGTGRRWRLMSKGKPTELTTNQVVQGCWELDSLELRIRRLVRFANTFEPVCYKK